MYSEVLYSEVEDITPTPYEMPVNKHRTPAHYEFQESKRGLLQIGEEMSLRRASGATINQPVVDQAVCLCVCVCVCACACVCVMCHSSVIYLSCVQDYYAGWVVPTMVRKCVTYVCVFVLKDFVVHSKLIHTHVHILTEM